MSLGIVTSAFLIVLSTVVISAVVISGLDAHGAPSIVRRIRPDDDGVVGGYGARLDANPAWFGAPRGNESLGPHRSVRALVAQRRVGRRYHARQFDREVGNLASSIAREMRAGRSLVDSFERGGISCGHQIGEDVSSLMKAAAGGADLRVCMAGWAAHRESRQLRGLVATISLGVETGGQLADSFDVAAASIRTQLELHDEVISLTSQSRASAILLTGLPVVAAVGLAGLNPESGAFLMSSAAGRACVGAAVTLDLAAWVWMRTLMQVAP